MAKTVFLSSAAADFSSVSENAAARSAVGMDASVRDFVALMKPRVMMLIAFSGLVGLWVAPGAFHPLLGFTTILCIALSAAGAASVNMWYDRDIDALMSRTRLRPVPQGRIAPQTALEFGVALIFGASLLMLLAVNALAAGLTLFAAGFYVFVYTMGLKRRTPWNIVIGGAAGAFPPVIGWAAVTGSVGWPALVLFLIVFFWTPPHFWALALYRNEDYRRAGVPMLPVVMGARRTKIEMLVYTLVLLPLSLLPAFMGIAGPVYLAGAACFSGLFVVCAVRVLLDPTHKAARQMFGYSIFYLAGLFGLLLVTSGRGMP